MSYFLRLLARARGEGAAVNGSGSPVWEPDAEVAAGEEPPVGIHGSEPPKTRASRMAPAMAGEPNDADQPSAAGDRSPLVRSPGTLPPKPSDGPADKAAMGKCWPAQTAVRETPGDAAIPHSESPELPPSIGVPRARPDALPGSMGIVRPEPAPGRSDTTPIPPSVTLAPRPPLAAVVPATAPAAPDIHIVIGRVELTVPPQPFQRSPAAVEPSRRQPQSLDDYLAAKRQA